PPLLQLSHLVPGARSGDFRRYLFLPSMCLPVLAAFGAERWLAGERLRGTRVLLLVLAVASAALFAVHLAPAATVERTYAELAVPRYAEQGVTVAAFLAKAQPTEGADNRAHLLATFLRAALAAGLAGLALSSRRRGAATIVALAAITIAE